MSMSAFILCNILTYICKAYRITSVINSWVEILYRKVLTYMAFAQFVLMGGLTYYVIILLKWQKEFHSQSLPKFVDSFTIPQTAWSHRIPILGWKLPHLFVTKCHHILECTYIMWMFPILLHICTHKYTRKHTHTHTHMHTYTHVHKHTQMHAHTHTHRHTHIHTHTHTHTHLYTLTQCYFQQNIVMLQF